jgi:hypothetical protein
VKIAVDLKNLFSFEKKNKKDKVDRKNRSTEHKFLLDFIYKNSKQKMKEAANHDLQWLKPFKIKEFVLGDFNYGALPDGEEKEYYKNLEISEKMDLLVKILQGAIRTRAKKWKYGLELMSKSEVLGAKYKPINKNLEKELSKSKILLDNLIKTAEIGVVVNNKDL